MIFFLRTHITVLRGTPVEYHWLSIHRYLTKQYNILIFIFSVLNKLMCAFEYFYYSTYNNYIQFDLKN